MSPLTIRRIMLWVVSMALGVFLTLAILMLVFPWKHGEVVSVSAFGLGYFVGTAFSLGMIFVTILDHFVDTKIWPS